MSDLISRAEAIDALKRKQDDGKGDLSRFYNTIIQHDIEAIMQLPPIQPKLLQPWEVLAAQSVLSQPEPHWIPIDLENNEPPLEEWVLVSSDGYVMQDCIVERGGRKIWYHGGNIQDDDRYMPLPEPYKGVTT